MTPTPTPAGKASVRPYRPGAGSVKRDINLLPANESTERFTKTTTIVLAVIVGLGVLYLVAVLWPSLILGGLNARANAAQNEKILLAGTDKEFSDRVAQRNALKEMIGSLDQSDKDFLQPADLFGQLTKLCPDSLTLTTVHQDADGLTLHGRSSDDADVAQFIVNLRTIKVFESVVLTSAKAKDQASTASEPREFEIKCLLHAPQPSASGEPQPTPAPAATTQGGAGQ